ncbi:MAG: hypothetical protein WCG98_02315 [bacterium]
MAKSTGKLLMVHQSTKSISPTGIGSKIQGMAILPISGATKGPVLNTVYSALLVLVAPIYNGVFNTLKSAGKSVVNIFLRNAFLIKLFFGNKFILLIPKENNSINLSNASRAEYPAHRYAHTIAPALTPYTALICLSNHNFSNPCRTPSAYAHLAHHQEMTRIYSFPFAVLENILEIRLAIQKQTKRKSFSVSMLFIFYKKTNKEKDQYIIPALRENIFGTLNTRSSIGHYQPCSCRIHCILSTDAQLVIIRIVK